MNKSRFTILILLVILLALLVVFILGCAPQEQAQEQEEKIKNGGQDEQVITQNALPPEIALLLEKNVNVKSMQFTYVSSLIVSTDKYFVKGDNIKVELMDLYRYNKTDRYDVVYLNLTEKKAKAYCELDMWDCNDIKDKAYDVSFLYYYKDTPLDWSNKIKAATNFTKLNTELVENKPSIHYSFTLNNKTGEIWIWEHYGLPIKIILDGKSYEFRNLAVNSLQDSDVVRK